MIGMSHRDNRLDLHESKDLGRLDGIHFQVAFIVSLHRT